MSFNISSSEELMEAEMEMEAFDAFLADHLDSGCPECNAACDDKGTNLRKLCEVATAAAAPFLSIVRNSK